MSNHTTEVYDGEVVEIINLYLTLTPEEREQAMREFLAALAAMHGQQA